MRYLLIHLLHTLSILMTIMALGPVKEWIVFPLPDVVRFPPPRTEAYLKQKLGDNAVRPVTSKYTGNIRIEYWFVLATDDQVSSIPQGEQGVSVAEISIVVTKVSQIKDIIENTPIAGPAEDPDTLHHRNDSNTFLARDVDAQQPNAPWDLRAVSFPPNILFPVPPSDLPDYTYDDAQGGDTWVYVIDSGVKIDNTVRPMRLFGIKANN